MNADHLPIIVGIGQFVERIETPDFRGLAPADLAAAAVRRAMVDSGVGSDFAQAIGAIGAIRTFEDSTPRPTPFGKPDKFPLAIARRVGFTPVLAILERAGGQSPVALLADLAGRIAAGQLRSAVVVGSEAISTTRHLSARGEVRDWAETLDGPMEDRGPGLDGVVRRYQMVHGLTGAPASYGLLENARRARLGMTRAAYAAEMGRLFAPFTRVAAANPYASAAIQASGAEDLIQISERNRMIADPYPLRLVSRDQVNQGAAVIITSVAEARALGVPEEKWIYIHGCALASERDMLERPDMGASPAARAALLAALERAGKRIDQIDHLDFYSCFPIAVFAAAIDGLGLPPDDPRGLTVTGGLPFFGGPGNNYSLHAIATMGERLRASPGGHGLVGANGGMLSKYGAMVMSTEPAPWPGCDSSAIAAELAETVPAKVAPSPEGPGHVITYTVIYTKGAPSKAVVVGELEAGDRFIANESDPETLARIVEEDPIGARIHVLATPHGNRFAFDRAMLRRAFPKPSIGLREIYENALVTRRGHVLEVTINQPLVRNALSTDAHFEFESIFDFFEAAPDLWVAIITGAGDKAFCAGADLRNVAGNRAGTVPRTGFAGLTSRVGRVKPIIAAVNGIAFGGGLETCLACDLVVADPSAKFGLTEVKVGMIAGAGGAARLPRQLPRKIALELLLTGRHMDVVEAKAFGLVNRVSEPGGAMDAARALADEIATASPTSVRLTMQLVHESDAHPDPDEAAAVMIASPAIDSLVISEDMSEGVAAFAQKRPPNWKNR